MRVRSWWGLTCSAVLLAGVFAAPATAAVPQVSTATVVPSTHPWLGFVGRWERLYAGDEAATVNSGSQVRLRFTGPQLTGLFDVSTVLVPPQLWVTVDGGPETLVSVDRPEIPLAPAGLRAGLHTMRIDVKDTDQVTNRWLPPLGDAVIMKGFRLAVGGHLQPPPRPASVRMAFYGDSITEGIRALGDPLTPDGADGTRTYASVTARALHADMQQVGFGKQGVMRTGVGNVPTAPESFPYNFAGSVADPLFDPDIVVLLQGSNDSVPTDAEFAPAYLSYLRQVRAAAPQAWIFAMEPLIGRHVAVIESDVAQLADPRMVFVNTDGWLDRHNTADYTDTVHPTVAGHLKVASHLLPIISSVTGLPVLSSPVRVAVAPIAVVAGQRVCVDAAVDISQVLPSTRPARGSVLVSSPDGFSVSPARLRYVVGRDGATAVHFRLCGTLPAGVSSVTGDIRVLVDDAAEVLPVPLVITAG
ncbi:MAG: GDSL-type esterase/lipase family protein [Pseudonocardiales bacterium]